MVVPQTAPSAAAKPRSAHAKKKARAHAKAETRRQQEADKVEAMPVTNHRAAGIDICFARFFQATPRRCLAFARVVI